MESQFIIKLTKAFQWNAHKNKFVLEAFWEGNYTLLSVNHLLKVFSKQTYCGLLASCYFVLSFFLIVERRFNLIMWFVVCNLNSASKCHVVVWFLILNWNFEVNCNIYTSGFFFFSLEENHLLSPWTAGSIQGYLWDYVGFLEVRFGPNK